MRAKSNFTTKGIPVVKARTLSKTDFILGCDCPAKLYYQKQGFYNASWR